MAKETEGLVVPLVERLTVAVERCAVELTALRVMFQASGVPGSARERASRAVGQVKTCVGAVRLWARVRFALDAGDREAVRDQLERVLAGLVSADTEQAALEEAAKLLETVHEKRAQWHDAKRNKGAQP